MSNPLSVPAAAPAASTVAPLLPHEGWFVQHLFYTIDHALWDALGAEEQQKRKAHLAELVQTIRSHPKTQLLTFSMVSPKSDIGFMLLTADLHDSNRFEKQLSLSLGADILMPAYSYLSMTEWTEYSEKEEDASARIARTENLEPGSEEHEKRMAEWKAHMQKYYSDRLYPNMPDWPVMCFYPMNKRRDPGANWFSTPFEQRREFMAGHAKTGRKYAGKVRQLVTGSTGLDSHEWSVTLFAHDLFQIKSIVYEMRFDEVSAKFAEFGDFYIGVQLPVDELLKRVLLA